MSDDKRPIDDKPGEKVQKQDQYNPVNMAGRKAVVLDERDEQAAKGNAVRDDDANKRKDHPDKNPKD